MSNKDRLKFTPIPTEKIEQLDYDERYVGFKHETTHIELETINNKRDALEPIKQTRAEHWMKEDPAQRKVKYGLV
jgi:hypothetical protein